MAEELELAGRLSIMTTEHFALEGARSRVLADMQGRVTQYLTTVSSGLVALAFVGQTSQMRHAFMTFAEVLLPALYVFGFMTFVRLSEASIEDSRRVKGLARIRHWYLEHAPTLAPYIVGSSHDDLAGTLLDAGVLRGSWFELLLTTQAVVAFVDSVILAVAAALAAADRLHWSQAAAIGAGVALAVPSMALQFGLSARAWRHADAQLPPRFPSPPA